MQKYLEFKRLKMQSQVCLLICCREHDEVNLTKRGRQLDPSSGSLTECRTAILEERQRWTHPSAECNVCDYFTYRNTVSNTTLGSIYDFMTASENVPSITQITAQICVINITWQSRQQIQQLLVITDNGCNVTVTHCSPADRIAETGIPLCTAARPPVSVTE